MTELDLENGLFDAIVAGFATDDGVPAWRLERYGPVRKHHDPGCRYDPNHHIETPCVPFPGLGQPSDTSGSVPEVDPLMLLADMDQSSAAYVSCRDNFLRYMAGEPLVRKHRRLDDGWSFLCPDPYCMMWRAGYETAGACRTGWYEHCDQRPHGFTPSWPADAPFEHPAQPVCCPRDGIAAENLLVDLIERGQAVDMAGRKLTIRRCPDCSDGGTSHLVFGGRTCPGQVQCPKCGVGPGLPCDRSTNELSPIRFGRHHDFSGHGERVDLARQENRRRAAAGDLRLPAPWRDEPAPTARRTAAPVPQLAATLRIKVPWAWGENEAWSSMAFEYQRSCRFYWTDNATVGNMMFPTVEQAKWSAGMLATYYGVPESSLEVVDGVSEYEASRVFSSQVQTDARQVLASVTAETPEHHLAWAMGVITGGHARDLVTGRITVAQWAPIFGGGTGEGISYRQDRKGFMVHSYTTGLDRLLTWPKIFKAIKGRVPPKLEAEMCAALAEEGSLPRQSYEHGIAARWCVDLAMQAWLAVRPKDLPAYRENSVPTPGQTTTSQ